MARPRVFISSTFFDLRQVRTDLDRFVKELGYDSIRNESGEVPYGKDKNLEEYCYKEISEIDILVGIVGGRFGNEAENKIYSITQTEIKIAIQQDKQVYVFIEKSVLAEYQTYLINKSNETTRYRFVDDKRIYQFIEELYGLPKNNIIHPFETAQEIVQFLKEQWAGLFRDLLRLQSRRSQYESISQKVNDLKQVSTTIQTYLENVLKQVSNEKSEATSLILRENKRLEDFHQRQTIENLGYTKHLLGRHDLLIDIIIEGITTKDTLSDLKDFYRQFSTRDDGTPFTYSCMDERHAIRDLNRMRTIFNKEPYKIG